jgi:4-hydroxy-tetrahydrodipicolinate synthase
VPSRTVCGLADETVARLAESGSFIGLKDATGEVSRVPRLRSLVGAEFRLLSGDDATAPAFIALGGDGCISVTSNVVPRLCREMFVACERGGLHAARHLAQPIANLTAALFLETNPSPVKHALSLLRVMSASVRLPMVEPTAATRARISAVLGELCEEFAEYLVGGNSAVLTQDRERLRA